MFRSRNKSKNIQPIIQSSLDSGNASIKRTIPASPIVISEEESYYNSHQPQPQQEYEDYHVDEIIDLQANASSTPTTPTNELTIESMSAVIAAAVQMSAQGGAKSSLSLGSASILQPFSKTESPTAINTSTTTTSTKRRFSTRLFSWSSKSSNSTAAAAAGNTSPTSSTAPTTPGLEPSSSPFGIDSSISSDEELGSPRSSSASNKVDDGRDELAYRGIQIKEIKTTLKTLVISDQVRNPMPEVKLERPGFARINY